MTGMGIFLNERHVHLSRCCQLKSPLRKIVRQLSFSDSVFDVITAVETHFWWPALPTDLREVLRVLKSGGRLIIIAEVYKGAATLTSKAVEGFPEKTGMALLSVQENRELLTNAGYSDVQAITEPSKGWICCIGSKSPVS